MTPATMTPVPKGRRGGKRVKSMASSASVRRDMPFVTKAGPSFSAQSRGGGGGGGGGGALSFSLIIPAVHGRKQWVLNFWRVLDDVVRWVQTREIV